MFIIKRTLVISSQTFVYNLHNILFKCNRIWAYAPRAPRSASAFVKLVNSCSFSFTRRPLQCKDSHDFLFLCLLKIVVVFVVNYWMYVTLLKDSKTMDAPDPIDNYLRLWGLEAYIASFKGKSFFISNSTSLMLILLSAWSHLSQNLDRWSTRVFEWRPRLGKRSGGHPPAR